MHPNFEKILRFAQSTGDRLIVTNQEGSDPMVVMSLASYAELVGFADLKKSVREEVVQAQGGSVQVGDVATVSTSALAKQNVTVDSQENPFSFPKDTQSGVSQGNQPTLAEDKDDSKDEGEEQFYLEPIE